MAKTDEDVAYRISAEQLIERTESRRVIPCTLSSDIGLSGGIPLGCTVLVGGKPKLGKTTFALQNAANAQNLFGCKVFFFPAEGRLTNLTLKQVRGLKKDIDNFETIMPPPILDKQGKVIGNKKWHAGRWWDEIGKTIQENPGSVIIVDSLASMTSEKESSEGLGYQGRGDLQKLEAQFCRIFGAQVIAQGSTLFLLSQIQANTSGMGASTQIKAGNSVRHAADIILFGKWFEKWKETDGRILGHDIHYTVEASALGAPWGDLVIPLRYGYGIDIIKDTITHAVNWEIIQAAGAWYWMPFVEKDGELEYTPVDTSDKTTKYVKCQGEQNAWRWLANPDNEKYYRIIEQEVRKKVFGE